MKTVSIELWNQTQNGMGSCLQMILPTETMVGKLFHILNPLLSTELLIAIILRQVLWGDQSQVQVRLSIKNTKVVSWGMYKDGRLLMGHAPMEHKSLVCSLEDFINMMKLISDGKVINIGEESGFCMK